jgi:hypothetical protein
LFAALELRLGGTPDLQHQVGAAGIEGFSDRGAGLGELFVDDARAEPRTGLDHDLETKADEPFCGVRRDRDPRLSRLNFLWNEDYLAHPALPTG